MRMALISFAWKRLVLAAPVWQFFWAESGYQLAKFRIQRLPNDISSFEKYAMCAQAGFNLNSLHGSFVNIKASPDAHLRSSMWIRAHVNQCSPRYIVYNTMETISYSSYDSQECRSMSIIDLENFPDSVPKTTVKPLISGSMLFAQDTIIYSWSSSVAKVADVVDCASHAESPFRPLPITGIGNGKTVPNAHADFPWTILSQRDTGTWCNPGFVLPFDERVPSF
jgi:hypothetical protein